MTTKANINFVLHQDITTTKVICNARHWEWNARRWNTRHKFVDAKHSHAEEKPSFLGFAPYLKAIISSKRFLSPSSVPYSPHFKILSVCECFEALEEHLGIILVFLVEKEDVWNVGVAL